MLFNNTRMWNMRVDASGFWRGMPQTLLQRQIPHTAFPHASRMSMAKRVRRFPGLTNSQACTMARKQFDQGVITQRLTPFGPLATHQKNKGTLTISRALLHHIGTTSLQRFRVKQATKTL